MIVDSEMRLHVRLLQRNRLLIVDWMESCPMRFFDGVKTVITDSHFLVPFFVLIAGIALLVVLH
jgi:hypothetical protein